MPLPVDLFPDPFSVLAAWPAEHPLCALWHGEQNGGDWISLATPGQSLLASNAPQLQALLREITSAASPHPASKFNPDAPPGPGWFGWISYDAGRAFEPAAQISPAAAQPDRPWPLAEFRRVDSPLAFHRPSKQWISNESASSDLIKQLRARIQSDAATSSSPGFTLGPFPTEHNKSAYIHAVGKALEYIRAGDIYQVNIAHRLSCSFTGSARALFASLAHAARPWHGGYFESATYALASASPEMFLSFDPRNRTLTTRPMKGTRAITGSDPLPRKDLEHSQKDRAELSMIVDLMRNDLGRVCNLGSVRVVTPRDIEHHASGVLQATATVTGALRPDLTIADALLATFPAGSVTGAPKIRAMQIIDELEPARRGPYCGSLLWLGDDGRMQANVLIRTACISQNSPQSTQQHGHFDNATLDYSVGAGIVADSNEASEWQETLAKASAMTSLPKSLTT